MTNIPTKDNKSRCLDPLLPLLIDLLVSRVLREESPNINVFRLAIPNKATYGLRLPSRVFFLRRGEQRGKEDSMIGRS